MTSMYGKAFASMYNGSMVGSGSHVFAVWGYCIANADPETHTVRLNPTLLATIIGDSEQRIKEAIEILCAPDKRSQCGDHDGRRLLDMDGMVYFMVTHERYRNIKNSADKTEYMREYMGAYRKCGKGKKLRKRKSVSFTPKLTKANSGSGSVSVSENTEEAWMSGEAFVAAWAAWETHRKEKRNAITDTTRLMQRKKLMKMGERRAIATIEHSITNGWLGLYEPDDNTQPQKPPPVDRSRLLVVPPRGG